jgi:hypothetical protein
MSICKQLLLFLSVGISVIVISCNSDQKNPVSEQQDTSSVGLNPYDSVDLKVEAFKVDSVEHNGQSGWGYDIMVNGKIHIHQPNIPSVMGNTGFSSIDKALRAGEFVIYKMKHNMLPPSVTPEELDSLGVLN